MSKLDEQPKEITVCNLNVLLMPQGEILCMGKTIGWFRDFKEHLSKDKEEEDLSNEVN